MKKSLFGGDGSPERLPMSYFAQPGEFRYTSG